MSAPLVKFKRTGDARIECVECVRETAQSVWVSKIVRKLKAGAKPERVEIRCAKMGAYDSYHDSWADAHTLIVTRAENEVSNAEDALTEARDWLATAKSMKPPAA
jgi:hypothetical protein